MSWQKILKSSIRSVSDLLEILDLSQHHGSFDAEHQFKTIVTKRFVDKINKGDLDDPLLKQILATKDELEFFSGFSKDPLEENKKNPVPGLLHKYKGRALLTFTGVCAINCRYCFRRHFPYGDNQLSRSSWPVLLNYLKSDNSITEIILSGGDPLLVSNQYISDFLDELKKISNIKTIRIHSRIPIVLPERIDNEFLEILDNTRFKKVMVVHTNHKNEWDADISKVMLSLKKIDFMLLNQSVLLAGVNDNAHTLAELSDVLFSNNVLPYYLHVLDPVQGTHKFLISDEKIKCIYSELQSILSGYLVPKLVKEIANKPNKILF